MEEEWIIRALLGQDELSEDSLLFIGGFQRGVQRFKRVSYLPLNNSIPLVPLKSRREEDINIIRRTLGIRLLGEVELECNPTIEREEGGCSPSEQNRAPQVILLQAYSQAYAPPPADDTTWAEEYTHDS